MENFTKEKSNLMKMGGVFLIIVSIYFGTRIISEVKSFKFIGGAAPASNTMSFEGKGEVTAAPDIATISFAIREDAKDVKSAQAEVTAKEKSALDFLSKSGIEKKDIKTENYSSYPKYNYDTPCYYTESFPPRPCPQGEPKITGYEVSEYISVKVRDLTKAGDIVTGLGAVGVKEISGPNFSVENEDKLKAQARKMAIDEAKAKAESLADDLGVRLVRIVNFSESGNYPILYAEKGYAVADSVGGVPVPSPEFPTGEHKIVSNVVITYEIR